MQLEKCPCCERGLESLGDFPLIHISNVERIVFPPFRDFSSLRIKEKGENIPQMVYDELSKRTEIEKKIINSPQIQHYILTLEGFAGKEVRREELCFKEIGSLRFLLPEEYRDIVVTPFMRNISGGNNCIKTTYVSFYAGLDDGCFETSDIGRQIARIYGKGRLNER